MKLLVNGRLEKWLEVDISKEIIENLLKRIKLTAVPNSEEKIK